MTTTEPPPSTARRTSGLAIAALVCGIVQFAGVFPAGIAAIILGHLALRAIRRTGEDGYGLAKAGLILGYIGLVLAVIGVGLAFLGSARVVPHVRQALGPCRPIVATRFLSPAP
jgi:hypothetical protein